MKYIQTKDDKSELELASIEQQRNDEDILKLVEDQKVCYPFLLVLFRIDEYSGPWT
jgi:hypothetical protein